MQHKSLAGVRACVPQLRACQNVSAARRCVFVSRLLLVRHFWQSQSESGYACVSARGGGAVTLATQLHILQWLPQRKNVFLQHAITTDYRLPSLHQKLSLEEKKQHICVCVLSHANRWRDRHKDKERWEMIIAHTINRNGDQKNGRVDVFMGLIWI